MNVARSAEGIRGYTISVRTLRGRLVVHVEKEALLHLGASGGDAATLLRTLNGHLTCLHALALKLAAGGLKSEVTISAWDVMSKEALELQFGLRQRRGL